MTRVYLPTTLDLLRDAWATGSIPPGPDTVVAEGEDEDAEYAALMTAADAAAALLPGGAGRRVVVVAEVADPDHPVPLKRVVAVHADPTDRPADADPDDDLAWYATQEVPDLF